MIKTAGFKDPRIQGFEGQMPEGKAKGNRN
jgi:hypothetical protein